LKFLSADKGALTTRNHRKKFLNILEIDWEEKTAYRDQDFKADLVMKSPGIPDTVPLNSQLKRKGIPIIFEIEFCKSHYNKSLPV